MELSAFARQKKIWDIAQWKDFLTDYAIPLYTSAWDLKQLYDFLKGPEICGKASVADIKDESLKSQIRTALYGGAKEARNQKESFALFMFERFGVTAQNAEKFQDSITQYETHGDYVKIAIRKDNWVEKFKLDDLTNDLTSLIYSRLLDSLKIRPIEIGINENYPHQPLRLDNPTSILPGPGESADNLIKRVNDFVQRAASFAIGSNPFTTLVFYARAIPSLNLAELLNVDIGKLRELVSFLGLDVYSMIDGRKVDMSSHVPVFFLDPRQRYSTVDLILAICQKIESVSTSIADIASRMKVQAISDIRLDLYTLQPYARMLNFLSEVLESQYNNRWIELQIDHGVVKSIRSGYRTLVIEEVLLLREFLFQFSPLISAGLCEIRYFNEVALSLEFDSHFGELIKRALKK